MSMGVDLHEIQSNETEMNIVQSPLQQHGSPGPPCGTMSRLVFQPALEEPGTNGQDSGEDESEGEESNDVVTFAPDIKPSTPPVDCQYWIRNALLEVVEEAQKLEQMKHIDDLGQFILD